jgi:hypothetical protein
MAAPFQSFAVMFEAGPVTRPASPRLWARFLRLASHIPKHFSPRHSALGRPVNMNLIPERSLTGSPDHNEPAVH